MLTLRASFLVVLVCSMLVIPTSATLDSNTTRTYSRDEFITRLMEVELMDRFSAEKRVSELEDSSKESAHYSYYEHKSLLDYGNNYVVEAGFLYVLDRSDDSKAGGIVTKWTAPTGKRDYTWTEFYHLVHFTPTQILQMVRGSVEVSARSGSRLESRLRRAGFQPGVVQADVWHSSKVSSWKNTILLGTTP